MAWEFSTTRWVGVYLGSTRIGVANLGCDVELVSYDEAVLSRGLGEGDLVSYVQHQRRCYLE